MMMITTMIAAAAVVFVMLRLLLVGIPSKRIHPVAVVVTVAVTVVVADAGVRCSIVTVFAVCLVGLESK
jgi:hypothetical protein